MNFFFFCDIFKGKGARDSAETFVQLMLLSVHYNNGQFICFQVFLVLCIKLHNYII